MIHMTTKTAHAFNSASGFARIRTACFVGVIA